MLITKNIPTVIHYSDTGNVFQVLQSRYLQPSMSQETSSKYKTPHTSVLG
jgi:hypothetical protein